MLASCAKKYWTKFYVLLFVMKIPNKRELQQVSFNHSSDIDCKTL